LNTTSSKLYSPKVCIQISLLVNAVLTIFKFFAGIVGLSKAMIADALHSLSDILTTLVVYVGVCIGEQPADEDHPYGHGNAETIAAVLVSLIILGIGAYAGISAVFAVIRQNFKAPLNIALLAAVVSIVVKEALYRYTVKVGKMSNNPAVIADAWHHRSDAYSSIAAFIGILGAKISFLYLDPIAAIVVSLLIVHIAVKLIRENIGIMMDERPRGSLLNKIRKITKESQGVCRIDNLKAHRRGSRFSIDLEIAVDSTLTVDEGHQIANGVKNKLLKNVENIGDVMVHVNPALPKNPMH